MTLRTTLHGLGFLMVVTTSKRVRNYYCDMRDLGSPVNFNRHCVLNGVESWSGALEWSRMECVFGVDCDAYLPTYYTNTCEQNGKALICDEGHVVKITDVRCFPYNITCAEREKIARLCDGLQSCARIDMRRQLSYYCRNFPKKNVITSFRCIPESERPVCRVNVCGEEPDNIRCQRGQVFHLLGAKCYHGQRECASDIYKAIYGTCDGLRTCSVSNLIDVLPSDTCVDKIVEQSNIFMDYICVDERVQTDNCTDRYITLTSKFGILKSPGYPNNPLGNSEGCRWVIYPEIDEVVDLYIHVAYSKEGREDCNYRFLQVQYTVCDSGKLKTDIFCDEGRINVKVHSCGTVYVMHWPYAPGEHKGNRFLISYHVTQLGSTAQAYVPYTFPCERIDPSDGGARYTIPKLITSETTEDSQSTTQRDILVDDQPFNKGGNATKGFVQNISKDNNKTQRSDPWKMVTLLRVVVVNIFLGLLIIALLMALIFVCYRYRTVGRRNKQNATPPSNTVSTLDDKGSTEMHPLRSSDKSPEADRYDNVRQHSVINIHNAETGEIHEEATVTITPNFETTIFHFNRQPDEREENPVLCSKSGISTFLPSSLNRTITSKSNDQSEELKNQNKWSEIDSAAQTSGHSCIPNRKVGNEKHESLHRYKIEEREYAIVLKSPQRCRHSYEKVPSSEMQNNPNNHSLDKSISTDNYNRVCASPNSNQTPADQSIVLIKDNPIESYSHNPSTHIVDDSRISPGCNSSIQYRPHIHPVPEDDYATRTTMHVIPEHNCLLHKIPPPPPPVQRGYWGPP